MSARLLSLGNQSIIPNAIKQRRLDLHSSSFIPYSPFNTRSAIQTHPRYIPQSISRKFIEIAFFENALYDFQVKTCKSAESIFRTITRTENEMKMIFMLYLGNIYVQDIYQGLKAVQMVMFDTMPQI